METGKYIFIDGPIGTDIISGTIEHYNQIDNVGAYSIFLGQVRADMIGDKSVCAIDYSCYTEMASEALEGIISKMEEKYTLTKINVYHSMGKVAVGELCLFVIAASRHRINAFDACREVVELIKKEVPIWGKEVFDDESYTWKKNNLIV